MVCIYYKHVSVKVKQVHQGRMATSPDTALRDYCAHTKSSITEDGVRNTLFSKLNCKGERSKCIVNEGRGYEEIS
jgi:hypothetical protein